MWFDDFKCFLSQGKFGKAHARLEIAAYGFHMLCINIFKSVFCYLVKKISEAASAIESSTLLIKVLNYLN